MATLGHVDTMKADEKSAGRERVWERWAASLAALLLAMICLIVVVSVVGRWSGHALIPDDVLLVRQLMIAVILLPLASVAARSMHIVVTIITDRLPSGWTRLLIRLGNGVGLVVISILMWGGMKMLHESWLSQEVYDGDLQMLLWPGLAMYVLALAVAAVRMAVEASNPAESESIA